MSFANPYLLALLLVLPVALWVKRRGGDREGSGRFSNVELFEGYRPTLRQRLRWLPSFIRVCALALLVVAIARPQTGQAQSELPGQGIDIALVLDTSSSMTTNLGTDTRIGVAQRVIGNFIKGRKDDRVGLVIFRSSSLVLSPLTLDYDALNQIVQQVGEINLPDGTAIGVGLSDALNLLRESRARSRVVILLTDGENNAGNIDPMVAAHIAQTLGIRVYAIGILDANSRGSNIDANALQQMATVTGGRYFPAQSEQALSQIYAGIDQLEKSRIGRPQYGVYNELAVYFLAASLGLLALELSLRGTVWRTAT